MSDAAVKESRRVLRLVQEHLSQAHLHLGAKSESAGLVDVVYHTDNQLPHLNFVSPRQKTAWVPAPEVEKGLMRLRDLNRTPRVMYIEGLYPPLFAKALRELGLEVERDIALMTCVPGNSNGADALPVDTHVVYPTTTDGIALWWYVWRNAYYDVLTGGAEPVYIGQELREIMQGFQKDILLYQNSFPIGVARLTMHGTTAHISAVAVMKEARTLDTLQHLYRLALKAALERQCELVFTNGESDLQRKACRAVGFVDAGSLVSYAEIPYKFDKDAHGEQVDEPVFVLR